MDNPWIIHDNSIDSDSLLCAYTTALTDFMENPYVPHGIHVFPMEFHEFPTGYPWVISMRVFMVYRLPTPSLRTTGRSCLIGRQSASWATFGSRWLPEIWPRRLATFWAIFESLATISGDLRRVFAGYFFVLLLQNQSIHRRKMDYPQVAARL